jgi:2-hydroxychromene-2-carboxylate isomerase
MKTIDLLWSFRRPDSCLAVPGVQRLERDFAVRVAFRPVLPLAVRKPGFFSPDNLKRARNIVLGWVRHAEMLAISVFEALRDAVAQAHAGRGKPVAQVKLVALATHDHVLRTLN